MNLDGGAGDDEVAQDFADILPDEPYEVVGPAPRPFRKWHLPRKQFVRREQWAGLIRKLLADRDPHAPLRYLSLPGIDLLDIRYLHETMCAGSDRVLRFLGFVAEAGTDAAAAVALNTSVDEVRRLANVDPRSEVLHDKFESIAQRSSMARRAAREMGPFDVVNIDLCGSVAAENPTNGQTLYDAIAEILKLQSRSLDPWLLLLTTRVDRARFHEESERLLVAHYLDNIQSCAQFAAKCEELFDVPGGRVDVEDCAELVYSRMIVISVCKWLMSLAQHARPTNVRLSSSQGYHADGGHGCEDIVSLALLFDPITQTPSEPLRPGPPPTVDECAEATKFVKRVGHLKNIDVILRDDPGLHDELAEETARLLTLARYDAGAYREWLASQVNS